jgi:hypothetical protein
MTLRFDHLGLTLNHVKAVINGKVIRIGNRGPEMASHAPYQRSGRRGSELLPYGRLVAQVTRAPIELDDLVASHALRQILVWRAHDDLVDARIGGGHGRSSGQRIVGHDDAVHCPEFLGSAPVEDRGR